MALLRDNITKLQEIAQITPFATNLFELDYFGRDGQATDDTASFELPNASIYCKKIAINGESLALEFGKPNAYTLEHYLDSAGVKGRSIDSISITWREHRDLRVWNYHRSWMNRWYSQKNDMFVVGPAGKKRSAQISIKRPYSIMAFPDISDNVFSGNLEQDNHIIRLVGLVPVKMPPFPTLSYGAAEDVSYDVTYKVDRIFYGPDLNNAVSTLETNLKSEYEGINAWQMSSVETSTTGLESMVDAPERII